MKGDFTRDTFLAKNHFSRVLWQQGRVQLDADFNEQVSIFLNYMQTLAADIIGPYGGPEGKCAFRILTQKEYAKLSAAEQDHLNPQLLEIDNDKDFLVTGGHYYVDGLLCEVDKSFLHSDYVIENDFTKPDNFPVLVYLDVWERLVTHSQNPLLREVALGGADTAARAEVKWQVKVVYGNDYNAKNLEFKKSLPSGVLDWEKEWQLWQDLWQPQQRGRLRAQCKPSPSSEDNDVCIIPPDSLYRGAENQLYRVEIHYSGKANATNNDPKATFKWSRDNGSVVFPIRLFTPESGEVFLDDLGQDEGLQLKRGDWVEVVDDLYELAGETVEARPLLKVKDPPDEEKRMVTLEITNKDMPKGYDEAQARNLHALLRRWDHTFGGASKDIVEQNGAIQVKETDNNDIWLPLENGIMIQFEPGHNYRRGDYWLIPARTVTGDIEWPEEPEGASQKLVPSSLRPHGVTHHYAPLAFFDASSIPDDKHREFRNLFHVSV